MAIRAAVAVWGHLTHTFSDVTTYSLDSDESRFPSQSYQIPAASVYVGGERGPPEETARGDRHIIIMNRRKTGT